MMAGQRVAEHISMSMQDCINAECDTLKVFVGHGAAFRHAAHILDVLNFDDIAKFSRCYKVQKKCQMLQKHAKILGNL